MSEQDIVVQIQDKINKLEELTGESLKTAMAELKGALKENPAACLLLLPEDIGQMVEALRKITGQALLSAESKKSKAGSKKVPTKITQADVDAALAELELD